MDVNSLAQTEVFKQLKVKDQTELEAKGYSWRCSQVQGNDSELFVVEVYKLETKKKYRVKQSTTVAEV